jgi:hypothetical protein
MKHEDYCTLLKNDEDKPYLTSKFLDVNMRLFGSSEGYKHVVTQAAVYIFWNARTTKDGYKKPHGYSGANAGIPWNIIATPEEVMLNPHILEADGITYSQSNCGSLVLDKPIDIWRYKKITFEFWDLDGNRHERTGYYPTIQHEIDHNKGILITDRRKET